MIYHIYDESPSQRFAALVEMVRRKAPLFMKAGGMVNFVSPYRRMTAERRRRVVELRLQKKSQEEIAREVGVSVSAVSVICLQELGPTRGWRQRTRIALDRERVMALRAEGLAWKQVADRLGVSLATLESRRREWDGPKVNRQEQAAA